MIGEYEEIKKIREQLIMAPHGLSITELSKDLGLHRTTVAKYLDGMQMRGEVDLRIMGTSKIYHPASRIPEKAFIMTHDGPYIFISLRLQVRDFGGDISNLIDTDNITGREIHDPSLRSVMQEHVLHLCKKAIMGDRGQAEIIIQIRGEKQYYDVKVFPIVFDDGRPGCVVALTDTTTFKKANEKSFLYDAEMSALAEEQNEFVFRINPDGILTYVNDAFCRRMERKREDLIGFVFEPVISHEDQKRLEDIKSQITIAHPTKTISFKAIQPDGMVAWEDWTFRNIYSNSGDLYETLGIGRDISRIHHLEEQLQTYHSNFESLVKQRTREMRKANQDLMSEIARRERIERELLIIQFVFDNASDSIILFERSGKVWRANETANQLLGYSKDEIRNLSVFDINPEMAESTWVEMWDEAGDGKESKRVQSIHMRRDLSIIKVEVSRKFITAGSMTLFCSIARQLITPQ